MQQGSSKDEMTARLPFTFHKSVFVRQEANVETEVERDVLVAALREWGIRFLAPSDPAPNGQVAFTPQELLARLAEQAEARLRLAIIPLVILHPELAQFIPQVAAALDEPARVELTAIYTAAVYLQRLWSVRLGFYLPEAAPLPDWFSDRIGLPSPDEQYGKAGLHALADWHAAHSPYPFAWLSSYQRVMERLFDQLKQETRQRERASTG